MDRQTDPKQQQYFNYQGNFSSNYEKFVPLSRDVGLFKPYQDYFLKYNIQYLRSLTPKYSEPLIGLTKKNASINRQLQYLRGNFQQHFCTSTVTQLINQSLRTQGFVKKKRNCSLYIDNRLLFTQDQWFNSMDLHIQNQNKSLEGNNVRRLLSCDKQILELFLVNNEERIIGLRTCSSLWIYSLKYQKLQSRQDLQEQITNSNKNIFSQKSLDITILNNNISTLYQMEGQAIHKTRDIEGHIVSLWRLSPFQLFFCRNHTAHILDIRSCKQVELQLSINSTESSKYFKERIYESIALKGSNSNNLSFAISSTFWISIFDIRKVNSPIIKLRHCFQQCPPSVLQFFDGYSDNSSRAIQTLLTRKKVYTIMEQPIIIAHSPYPRGCSMFTSFKFQQNSQLSESNSRKENSNKIFSRAKKLKILFDSGKILNGPHPHSITPYFYRGQIIFFHVDNYGGISLQSFRRNKNQDFEDLEMMNAEDLSGFQKDQCLLENKKYQKKQIDPSLTKLIKQQIERFVVLDPQRQKIQPKSEINNYQYQDKKIKHHSITYYKMKKFTKILLDPLQNSAKIPEHDALIANINKDHTKETQTLTFGEINNLLEDSRKTINIQSIINDWDNS